VGLWETKCLADSQDQTNSDSEILRPRENPPSSTGLSPVPTPRESHGGSRFNEVDEKKKSATVVAAARDFAVESYRKRFNETPNWFQKDYAQLEGLFKRKTELTLDEFKRRWIFYLKSTDPFYTKNGFALGFFCKMFDAFRNGPLHERGAAPENPGMSRRELERRRAEISPEGQRRYKEQGISV
jgi:hypothetical protein